MFISLNSHVLFLYENLTSAALSNEKLYWQFIHIWLCNKDLQQEEFEDTNRLPESVNRRRTDKSMTKSKQDKGTNNDPQSIHMQLKIE